MSTTKDRMQIQIDHNLRLEGNHILEELGISPTVFITMAYKRLVGKRGIPFETTLSQEDERKRLNNQLLELVHQKSTEK